jgi:hypothetical protein
VNFTARAIDSEFTVARAVPIRRQEFADQELADTVGCDYTTGSRQVAKPDSLGYVRRRVSKADRQSNQSFPSLAAVPFVSSWHRT